MGRRVKLGQCPANALRLAKQKGMHSACKPCLRAIDGPRGQWAEAWRHDRLLSLWQASGALYTSFDVDKITAAIRQDSDLPEPQDLPPWPPTIDEAAEHPPHHRNVMEDYAMTLEEIGQHFGFTRERARQVIEKALQHFGKNWVRLEKMTRDERLAARNPPAPEPEPIPLPRQDYDDLEVVAKRNDYALLDAEVVGIGKKKPDAKPALSDAQRRKIGRQRRAKERAKVRIVTLHCNACDLNQKWAVSGGEKLQCAGCGAELVPAAEQADAR